MKLGGDGREGKVEVNQLILTWLGLTCIFLSLLELFFFLMGNWVSQSEIQETSQKYRLRCLKVMLRVNPWKINWIQATLQCCRRPING